MHNIPSALSSGLHFCDDKENRKFELKNFSWQEKFSKAATWCNQLTFDGLSLQVDSELKFLLLEGYNVYQVKDWGGKGGEEGKGKQKKGKKKLELNKSKMLTIAN